MKTKIQFLAAFFSLMLSGCQGTKPLRGGGASTTISHPGHTNAVTLTQSENPKEPSRQSVQSEQSVEYILPPGTVVPLHSPETPLNQPSPSHVAVAEGNLLQIGEAKPALGYGVLEKAMPVRVTVKDRSETSIGGAQKDTAREWAARAANMQPVMWAGIALMTLVAGVLAYFGWWTKAALAIGVGVGMIVLAQTLPEHGTLILFGGLGVFSLIALLILYTYYKGKLDQDHNGIPDFLEKKSPEVKV